MKSFLPSRPSPALVISLIALFVALGGTGYAALKLPKNSVGTKQLRRNAVTGAKVKNGSLRARDFRAGQLPAGPKGAQGPPGPVNITFVKGTPVTVAPGKAEFVDAPCPTGMTPSGGGVFNRTGVDAEDLKVNVSSTWPTRDPGSSPQPNAWGGWVNNTSGLDDIAQAYAVCVQATNVSSNY